MMRIHMDVALRNRHCSNCGNTIAKSEKCLHFAAGSGASSVSGNVCQRCLRRFATETLDQELIERYGINHIGVTKGFTEDGRPDFGL